MGNKPKFRGYSIENKSWHYGFGWCLDGLTDECKQSENIEDYAVLYTESSPVKCDLKSMGQYTGLKDKYGREIYEGDIVDDDQEPMKVEYQEGSFGLKFLINIKYFDNCVNWDCCEVIGNIYENPELIEV